MHRLKVTLGILAITMGGLMLAAPVGAQTVYNPGTTSTSVTPTTGPPTTPPSTTPTTGPPTSVPPTTPPSTTPPGATSGPQSGGTVVKGETFSSTLCGFQPGSTVSLSVDGQAGPSTTADSRGCVTITTTVLDNSHVQVMGVTFNAACGPNSIIASSTSFSQTETFTISCASAVATPTSSSGGGLAFTGANVLKLGGAAGLLILFGAVLVIAERRRNRLQG